MPESISLETVKARIRDAYQENLYVGLCTWFKEFDRAVFASEFAVCEGLLKEVREQSYLFTKKEQLYVDSREGVLLLQQGIEQHRQGEFGAADVAYRCSLAIQQRVKCWEAQDDVELLQKLLNQDRVTGDPTQDTLNLLQKQLKVLGGDETLLCDRIAEAPMNAVQRERCVSILLASIQLRFTKPLIQALDSPDEQIRMMAIAGLEQFETISPLENLLPMLQDQNWFVRWRVAEIFFRQTIACPECGEDNSVGREFCSVCDQVLNAETHAALCKALEQETTPDVKQLLIGLLGQPGNQQALLRLVAALDDSDTDVRIAAIEALIRSGNTTLLKERVHQIRPGKSLFRGSVEQKLSTLSQVSTEQAVQLLRAGTPITTIVVSQAGDADYTSIRAAIAEATPGAKIIIRSGTYSESLVLDKPLELIGEDSVRLESSELNTILMQAPYAIVRNLSIHAYTQAQERFAVSIAQGELLLEACEVTSSSLACIGIYNVESTPVIRRCRIHSSEKQGGILFYFQARGIVEDCDIFGNAISGIEIGDEANPTIRQCRIYDGKTGGILVNRAGKGLIEDCDIYSNTYAGIEVREQSNSMIRRCRIHTGKSNGVRVCEQGQVILEDCNIAGNEGAGIMIDGEGTTATLRNCQINQNTYQAVWVGHSASATIENCDLTNNRGGAWEIAAGCQVSRQNNQE